MLEAGSSQRNHTLCAGVTCPSGQNPPFPSSHGCRCTENSPAGAITRADAYPAANTMWWKLACGSLKAGAAGPRKSNRARALMGRSAYDPPSAKRCACSSARSPLRSSSIAHPDVAESATQKSTRPAAPNACGACFKGYKMLNCHCSRHPDNLLWSKMLTAPTSGEMLTVLGR